jgi:YHS domain-containing protein
MKVQDPVCGRSLDSESAAAQMTNGRRDMFFCSDQCRSAFEAEPARYVAIDPDEPPFTASKHFAAPKFGSAGSGGAEYEPGPPKRKG